MIFISSACIKSKSIVEAVRQIAEFGFCNIELSGGTKYFKGYESGLISLKKEYNLNYQLHNYFPPPKKHFMLNLCSNDNEIQERSMKLCKEAIRLSNILGGKKYGIHAGFLIDFSAREAGKNIFKRK